MGDPGYIHTHTASSTPIAAAANASGESARERGILSAPGSGECERLLAFWRGGVYGKPDSDSMLQQECPERLFKRGAKACWAGTLCAATLPARGNDLGHSSLPLNTAGQRDQKGEQGEDSSAQARHSQQAGGGREWRVQELDWLELST